MRKVFMECDRCHKMQEYNVDIDYNVHVTLYNGKEESPYTRFDLCDECRKEFGRWLSAGEEKAKE